MSLELTRLSMLFDLFSDDHHAAQCEHGLLYNTQCFDLSFYGHSTHDGTLLGMPVGISPASSSFSSCTSSDIPTHCCYTRPIPCTYVSQQTTPIAAPCAVASVQEDFGFEYALPAEASASFPASETVLRKCFCCEVRSTRSYSLRLMDCFT